MTRLDDIKARAEAVRSARSIPLELVARSLSADDVPVLVAALEAALAINREGTKYPTAWEKGYDDALVDIRAAITTALEEIK